ncbi:MAG: hypothetical protein KC933_05950 [Myxococcales bacterium]|nr:hypothetical protein [Myxococcales bacterium]MCB9651041.1 hypothetical protein [Deltaproteobacteria bacterium]
MPAFVGAALTAGRVLLGRIGLNPKTLTTAGKWLKDALWGNTFSKVTTSFSAAKMVVGKPSKAQSSQAAQQLQRAEA